jgi:outer membrane protein TolC
MIRTTHFLTAVLLLAVLFSPVVRAQNPPTRDYSRGVGTWPNFAIYKPIDVSPADLSDSPRIDSLIREGKLYLSLSDAIALAIENNLDIASARYGPKEADTDILRTRAGANLSGIQTQINTLSTGQSVSGGGGQISGPGGQATGITTSASDTAQAAGGAAGNAASFFGTQVVSLDPTFSAGINLGQQSNPQISSFVTGTNTLTQDIDFYQLSFSKGFVTGTTVNLGFTSVDRLSNSLRDDFNPTVTADLSLVVRQRLLQGFGPAVNSRQIRVAKNNREISDLVFKQQVIETVAQVQNLYWDLVSLREQVKARQTDLQLSEQLVRDNKRQVELGLLARVEVVRAQAEASSFRQQLVQAEANVRAQQDVLKNAITKHGPASATLGELEIVPTDSVAVPQVEPVQPVQDLIARALQASPSLTQARIGLTNSDITLKGIRDSLLPSLDVVGFATNNGLAGSVNPNLIEAPGLPPPNPFFLGGLSTVLGQVFRRNFPDYGVRFEMNIPLKNRQAQADMSRNLLSRRRQDIQLKQQENRMILDVKRSVNDLRQARESYDVARESRALREEMLSSERQRFQLGTSTIFQIVQAQRDLAQARTSEISALGEYMRARVALDRITSRTLETNGISIDEAYVGSVSKDPDPPPPLSKLQDGIAVDRPRL